MNPDTQNKITEFSLHIEIPDFVSSVSDYSTDGFVAAFPWLKEKIQTIYFGPHKNFRVIDDQPYLESIRAKYNLPENFILTVIRYDHGTKNTRKNFPGMAEAFAKYKKMGGEKLLVKMQMGGASMDMSDPLVDAMRGKKGKEIKKPMYKMGGWTSYKK